MRIVVSIMFFVMLLVPQGLHAQDTVITIPENQLFTLEEIFEVIKSQTEYQFVYPSSILENSKTIPVEKGNIIIKDLLSLGLAAIDCSFQFQENTIVVKKRIHHENDLKLITGRILFEEQPIEDVHILVRSKKGTRSNENGYYQIHASIGDVIRFSHVSFKPIEIIVEDVTQILNLEMTERSNLLDETVINVEKPDNKIIPRQGRKVKTAFGEINPALFSSRMRYLNGQQLRYYNTLTQALAVRISGEVPTIFDIDGQIYYDDTILSMNNIVDVFILYGANVTARWGGPVALVTTIDGIGDREKQLERSAEQYRNQNFYDDKAKTTDPSMTLSSDKSKSEVLDQEVKEVFGKITYEGLPLSETNIRIIGTPRGTKTNENGEYRILTKMGDELRFSYVGFHAVSVIVEDVTAQIDVAMIPSTNSLDEVLILAKTKTGRIIDRAEKAALPMETSRGVIEPNSSTTRMSFLDQSDLNQGSISFSEAIAGRLSGVRRDLISGKLIIKAPPPQFPYPVWDVDGQLFTDEPALDPRLIESVYIIRNPGPRYGPIANGGVIVIKTSATGSYAGLVSTSNMTNTSFYNNDAVQIANDYGYADNEYITLLKKYTNRAYAYLYYENTLRNEIRDYSDHIAISRLFSTYFNDQYKATKILVELAKTHYNHPEILKAIGYNLQAIGEHREAVKVYQKVFKLRTSYAQSYRDLANAYKENNQFKRSWRMYMSYLLQGHKADFEGIGETIYNEMEYLFFARPNQTQIKERFEPRSEDLFDFRNDVRFVVEWNTSEAEFDLEFVAPDRRAYVFEHTLVANQDLINFEKRRGFSSKEFFIDDIGDGEWLMNLTYFGNKKIAPTYIKVTTYYNWGKASQKQETTVYKLDNQKEKLQLKRINKQKLLANN